MDIQEVLWKLRIENDTDIAELQEKLDMLCRIDAGYDGFFGHTVFDDEIELLKNYIDELKEC